MTHFDNRDRVTNQAGRQIIYGGLNVYPPTPHAATDQDSAIELPQAVQAAFNCFERRNDPLCLPETRVDLLQKIKTWADEQNEKCIFWLSGFAGTGKSTIARTVAREYKTQERLGASFMFSRGNGDVSHAGKFCTTIAVQLADWEPSLRAHIYEAVSKHRNIANQALTDQWIQLVLLPLSKLENACIRRSLILVVDALDECDHDDDVQVIVQLLAKLKSVRTIQIRIFMTSRPETAIRHSFDQLSMAEHQDFVLHKISSSVVDDDISIFLKHSFDVIGQKRRFDRHWPGDQTIQSLVRSASGLFIWAATACRFIDEGKLLVKKRLSDILDNKLPTNGSHITPENQLSQIYKLILQNCIHRDLDTQEKENVLRALSHILGTIVVLFTALSPISLANLVQMPLDDLNHTLADLHSILDISQQGHRAIRLHHPSFRDFLLNKQKYGDHDFSIEEKKTHQTLTDHCIQLMSDKLAQDICNIHAPSVHVDDIPDDRIKQFLPAELQYACLYWVQHLAKSQVTLRDDNRVHQFLRNSLLHWLEALSLMRMTSPGILAINTLESLAKGGECPGLYRFIHDAKRFALYNRSIIEEAPLQTYYSALLFAPRTSILRTQFCTQMPFRIISKLPEDWSSLLQTLEGHSGWVNAVAFSPDGRIVASASDDKTVRLWDAATGASRQTLEGHSGSVSAVAFSPDGRIVASASDDKTVRLWDAATGASRQTLGGHSRSVNAVAFSPDGRIVASASNDKTVRLWDTATGASRQTLKGHSGWVNAVAFSPDGRIVASASNDKTVRLWDAATGASRQTLEGHSGSVNAVTFSPDGRIVASASNDNTVRLWDAATGASRQTLEGHSGWVNAVAFSPDGRTVASASNDTTVRLWDATTGALRQTLEGHSRSVNAVAFSPDGRIVASASDDKTVRLWDATTGASRQTLEGHSGWVSAVAFSPDGRVVASASEDETVRLWDAATGASRQTLEGHSGWVNAVAFSPDGRIVASASDDKTVRLWDAATGASRQMLKGHSGSVNAVTFSPDGRTVASASDDKTVRLWDATTGALRQTLKGHSGWVNAVTFSPDGRIVASASDDKTVRLWDATTGASRQTLEGHSGSVSAVAFSPDGRVVASASDDKTVRLWDAATGVSHSSLEVDSIIKKLTFSDDGQDLWTNNGRLGLNPLSFSSLQPKSAMDIVVNDGWVSQGGQRILYLPREYRAVCATVKGYLLVMGHASGHISILESYKAE